MISHMNMKLGPYRIDWPIQMKLGPFLGIVLFLLISGKEVLYSQVEWKDRYVTHAEHDQQNPATAYPAQSDFTIVVWEDERANDGTARIYAQKIDNATGVALWDYDGVKVVEYTNSSDQRNPRAAFDSLGGVIIVWEDSRHGTEGSARNAIYAQRLDVSSGGFDPAWPNSGRLVSDPDHNAMRPRIVSNSDGAYVAWMDQQYTGVSDWIVFAQYLKAGNQAAPGAWNTPYGIRVTQTSGYDETNPELTRFWEWSIDANSENHTGVAIAYQKYGFTSNATSDAISNVFVSVLDADGSIVYRGPVSRYDENQILPQIVATGERGANAPRTMIVAWQDSRDNPSPVLYGIWGQRMYSNGTIYGGWPLKIADAQNDPTTVVTRLFEGYSSPNHYPYLSVVWKANSDIIEAGLVDAEQASLVGSLTQISYEGGTQPSADIVPINFMQANLYIGWRQMGGYSDIFYQHILIPAWTEEKDFGGWPVTQAKRDQNSPQVCGSVFAFEDGRRSALPQGDNRNDMDISCQTPGECTGPSGMAWRDRFVQWTPGTNAQNKKMVVDRATGDYSTFVVWDELRAGTRSVFIQKLDKDGVPRWENNGVRLTAIGDDAHDPDVSYDGSGGAMVVYLQTQNNVDIVYYSQVDVDGIRQGTGFVNDASAGAMPPKIVRTVFQQGISYLVAFLHNGQSERRYSNVPFNQTGNVGSVPISNANVLYHSDLRLVGNDEYGGAYIMTNGPDANGTKFINVTFLDLDGNYSLMQDELCAISTMDNYDICMDVFRRGNLLFPDAMIAYAHGVGAMNLHLARVSPLTGGVGDLKHTNYQGVNTAKAPVIVPDSIDGGQGNGGCLVAWEHQYVAGVSKFEVLSNRFTWAVPAFVPQYSPDIVVSSPECEHTHPAMARINHRVPQGTPTALIAWEDACENSPCSPARPTSILCRQVVYPIPGPCVLWNQSYQASPGPGNYTQTRPELATSEDGSAMLMWYDTRTSDQCLLTTRMYDNEGAPGWFKSVEEQETIRTGIDAEHSGLDPIYPVPFSSSAHRALTISWRIPTDAVVRLQVFDPLGRLVATLEDGLHPKGRHNTTWHADRDRMAPGVYYCTLSSLGSHCTRLFTVVR
jgi:hypothetical protein